MGQRMRARRIDVDFRASSPDNAPRRMVFSSVLFLFFFLPAALAIYFATPRRFRFVTLTLCSYAFYAWSDPRFLLLLLWITVVDFTIGNLLGTRHAFSPCVRRGLLIASLVNSLGLLAWFKYAVFAHGLMSQTRTLFGGAPWTAWSIVLPAGISFYTFESISYVVDVYRGDARPAGEIYARRVPFSRRTVARRAAAQGRAFVSFACYLAQFPHLVAGPIVRYQELEPQLLRPRVDVDRFARGAMLLSFGLAKKVLIANVLAAAVQSGFDWPMLAFADTWLVALGFAFQLYFDFSGYTDMACGMALMLGFDFPRNFDAPYRATGIADFWRRWHMTLSRWLRDYLYIPLGGNRRGARRASVNVMITMLLGGLWHGASLNFAAWGLWHGLLLVGERAIGWRDVPTTRFPTRLARRAITFVLVCVGWVIFRSTDLPQAFVFAVQMFAPTHVATPPFAADTLHAPLNFAAIAAAALLAFSPVQAWNVSRRVTPARVAVALVVFVFSAGALSVQSSNPFLYFRF